MSIVDRKCASSSKVFTSDAHSAAVRIGDAVTAKPSRSTASRMTSHGSCARRSAMSRCTERFSHRDVATNEKLTDARHVRNAVARFDQVEGVSDAERDRAWKRIRAAARKFDVELSEKSWREPFKGGKARKR